MIRLAGVTLGYGTQAVVSGVSFDVERGEIAALLGPNGAGKTTVLRALLGEIRPWAGRIEVAHGVRIGYVPQVGTEGSSWPIRVHDLLRLFCRDDNAVRRALAGVGIGDLGPRTLQDLSGGQRQKVLLAKALANEPSVLLLDEPTQGMDAVAEADYIELLRRLAREGLTVVLVTHLLHVALSAAQRVVIIDRGTARGATIDEILRGEVLDQIYGRPFLSAVLGDTPVMVPERRSHD